MFAVVGRERVLCTAVCARAVVFQNTELCPPHQAASFQLCSVARPPCLPPCRRDGGIFTAGYEEGQSPEQQAALAAAAGPPAPSPPMLRAADSLQQLLRALAQHLDAVVFR